MNHFLDLANRLSKTDLALEVDEVRMVVSCDNGEVLSIISNGYGHELGLLELMRVTGGIVTGKRFIVNHLQSNNL